MNRRHLLQSFAALTLLSAWNPGRRSLVAKGKSGERIIVIGAGVAGLSAARTLADSGYEVVVLEARNRIGGRTTRSLPSPIRSGQNGRSPAMNARSATIPKARLSAMPETVRLSRCRKQ